MVVIEGKPPKINRHKPISSMLKNVIQLFIHKLMKRRLRGFVLMETVPSSGQTIPLLLPAL